MTQKVIEQKPVREDNLFNILLFICCSLFVQDVQFDERIVQISSTHYPVIVSIPSNFN